MGNPSSQKKGAKFWQPQVCIGVEITVYDTYPISAICIISLWVRIYFLWHHAHELVRDLFPHHPQPGFWSPVLVSAQVARQRIGTD